MKSLRYLAAVDMFSSGRCSSIRAASKTNIASAVVRKCPVAHTLRTGLYFGMLRLRSALHQDAYQYVVGEKRYAGSWV